MRAILKEFLLFLIREKRWWLIPLVLVVVLLGFLAAFRPAHPLSDALYPVF